MGCLQCSSRLHHSFTECSISACHPVGHSTANSLTTLLTTTSCMYILIPESSMSFSCNVQSDAPSQLVTLLKAGVQKPKKGPRTGPQEGYHSDLPRLADAAAAARALTELARTDVAAAKLAVAQGALPVLVALLDQGSEAEAMEALGLLSCLSTGDTPAWWQSFFLDSGSALADAADCGVAARWIRDFSNVQ